MAVARSLRHLKETENKFIYVYSIVTSQNELLASFQKMTGQEWAVEHVSMDSAIKDGRAKWEQGDRVGLIPLILSYWFREGMGADYTKDVEAANELLGLPEENLDDIVRASIA